MKILETVFFALMIIVPTLFLILGLANIKKVKSNKKFRTTLLKFILLGLLINGVIWYGLKITNDKEIDIKANEPKSEEKNDGNSTSSTTDDENNTSTKKPDVNQNEPKDPATSTNPKPNEPTEEPNKPTIDTPPPTSSGVTTKGFAIETKDGITYVDGYLIVNKTYPLPEDYVPKNTYKTVNTANCADCLDKSVIDAYNKMKTDAAANGLTLWIASGFRSYGYQTALYNGYANANGKAAADTYSARPGHSEHQSGLAFDLNTVTQSFADTKEGIWINENCHKYGFIIRYPKGKDNETGYIYEPWHLRYVGENLASKLYNNGDWITMETYFGITSQYN